MYLFLLHVTIILKPPLHIKKLKNANQKKTLIEIICKSNETRVFFSYYNKLKTLFSIMTSKLRKL